MVLTSQTSQYDTHNNKEEVVLTSQTSQYDTHFNKEELVLTLHTPYSMTYTVIMRKWYLCHRLHCMTDTDFPNFN